MTSRFYSAFAEDLFDGTAPSLTVADIRAVLIDVADYTFSAAHVFLNSVPAGARVGTPVALATKTVTGGVFNADPTTILSVAGDQTEVVILFIHTGVDTTAQLICYLDEGSVTVLPNGENININWNALGVIRLVP